MISTPLPQLTEMTDILDLKDVNFWDLRWIWVLGLIILLIILSLVLWVIIRRLRKKPEIPPKPLTPLETALKKLEDLVQSRFVESGQVRRFYFGLSELFREFIERELGFKACEETLEELRPQLKKCEDLEPRVALEAITLLEVADFAKFAKFVPEHEEILANIRDIRRWMNQVAERRRPPTPIDAT